MGARWEWGAARSSGRFILGNDPAPIVQGAGRLQGRSVPVRKILPPTGFDPRTIHPVTQYVGSSEICRSFWYICIYLFIYSRTALKSTGVISQH